MSTASTCTTEWVFAPGVESLDRAIAGFWRSLLGLSYAMDVWSKVAADVRADELGLAACIRPIAGGRLYELRIYGADVADQADVLRVRRFLRVRLGCVEPISCYNWHGGQRWLDPGARETTPKELWRWRTEGLSRKGSAP